MPELGLQGEKCLILLIFLRHAFLCYIGKPTLYGSLTCQGIGLDGIPEVTASEGFIVNEINKVGFYVF